MTNEVLETDTMVKGEDDDGNKTINKYAVIQEIGRGVYGKVKLVVHVETEQFYALKVLNKQLLKKMPKGDKTRLDDVEHEIAVMKRFSHPNVVSLHEVINDPSCNKVYLIMDYVEGGCIWKMGMPPLPYDKLRNSVVGMCHGLDYIHLNNVLHRDIKPENLLVSESGAVQWCDFGVSSARDANQDGIDDLVQDTEGTPAFLTPEQIKAEAIQGTMTDIWALGVTIFCLAFGRLPFTGTTIQEMNHSIVNEEPDFGGCANAELKHLIGGLLEKNLLKRMGSVEGAREILAHPFLTGCDVAFSRRSVIRVTDADVATAVRTGHNIKLKLASTVSAAMRVQHFKLKLLRKRQERLSMESVTTEPLTPMSPTTTDEFRPFMSPTQSEIASPTAEQSKDFGLPQAILTKQPTTGKASKIDPALYFKINEVPQLVDRAVRHLVAARPDDPAQWLSEYFSSLRNKRRSQVNL